MTKLALELSLPAQPSIKGGGGVAGATISLSANTIAENAALGAAVGTLSVSGATGTPTYSLTDTAGSRFALSGSAVQRGATALDYETATSHNITVHVVGTTPLPSDTVFAITVTDVVESGYETEADTLFAAMSPAPDTTRKGHINTLIAALKSGGIWTKLDLLYILAAHDAQAARLNWKTPASYAMTAVNSPVFTTDRGYAGDGSSMYLNTSFSPSTNAVQYTQNSAHMGAWLRTFTISDRVSMGFNSTSGHLYPKYADNNVYARINGSHGGSANPGDALAFILANRSGASAIQVYRNGVSIVSVSNTSGTVAAGTLTVLADLPSYCQGQCSAATFGGNLSAGEHTSFYNAVQAYMTAVGA